MMTSTTTTMSTVIFTPGSSRASTADLDEDPSPELITQSAPTTPLPARHNNLGNLAESTVANNNAGPIALQTGKKMGNRDFYRAGFESFSEGLMSCFKPVWGYFGRSAKDMAKSIQDDWEIPFESITNLQWLGAGSQGAVFGGNLNGTTVAVKKVKELKETDIKHLRHLTHTNIIQFMGICTQAPCYCIVMEFCPKGLCGVLKSDRVIDHPTWINWAKQIASGMGYLHSNNVIHRDLKSPNILFDESDTIKICDFGTSHQKGSNDTASVLMSFCGTVSWMAPEMMKKEPCSEKVDVYSFGVVLWEMITREQPYKDIDQMAIIYGVGNGRLTLPMPEDIPDGLAILIKQCLCSKARNRPSFTYIHNHLNVLQRELEELGEDEWQRRMQMWRIEAARIKYPTSLTQSAPYRRDEEAQLIRRRKEELKHSQDIRFLYEKKLERTNRVFADLQNCLVNLQLWEQDLIEREMELSVGKSQRGLLHRGRVQSFNSGNAPKSTMIRVGGQKKEQDVYCTAINAYPYDGRRYSTEEECDADEWNNRRGSPYRCSQTSSSSGFPSTPFSRQSSARSSTGISIKPREHKSGRDRERPNSYWEEVRGSSTRCSGMSQDSGIGQAGNIKTAESCCILDMGVGQPACFSQTIYRNGEGRWSDGRIAQRRKMKKPRDSPMKTPQQRRAQRSSFPSNSEYTDDTACTCNNEHCCGRKARARSLLFSPNHSNPAFDDCEPSELNVSALPSSSSYNEALRHASEPTPPLEIPPPMMAQRFSSADYHHSQSPQVHSPVRKENTSAFNNPLYQAPVTSYINPLATNSVEKVRIRHRFLNEDQVF
ncbi:hypothetical protein WR25_20788 isoform L [Diploscapter pachys]|uniref:Protein kinase domain-containing protein n=1 Tax=Diploscapter pachys TaxID=2018661 RepID=A0A2A2KDQ7_9BILA|nr:hypothetical protein WR25_20788 isoform B [Diploscapter pachys]PAV72112.1 hypothetical protein WR25_20788 isoform G [Diploscapter pachys]PAV72114.1 hypothetical protein WR25_20788 isoform I [Diploscapter pachys]PAV72117.1 hypothetical protein WR25_20788 isoform L [Diploscapter pachys]